MTLSDPREFSGKRVLVTGGTKGAGKAIAGRFLQGGATVAITARSVPTEKTSAHYIQADVSTKQGTSKVFGACENRPGNACLKRPSPGTGFGTAKKLVGQQHHPRRRRAEVQFWKRGDIIPRRKAWRAEPV